MQQSIENIENGLVEFDPPQDFFQVHTVQKEHLKVLTDRMAFYKIPGVSIAIINDFTLDWVKSYGILKSGTDDYVTPHSIFQAGSTSKLLTAVTTLHYIERGDLNLDEDVNNYLKSWKVSLNDFTRIRPVTLRLLLSHLSGIPGTNFSWDDDLGDPTLVQVLGGTSPALNKPAIVERIPGTKWEYSNLGFVVIQQILEDALGKPFTQITQETIFTPLDMNFSTFQYPLPLEQQSIEAMPHDDKGCAQKPALPPSALAQGGLLTTPSDLAKFTLELLNTYRGVSNKIISQNMVKKMFEKAIDLDPNIFGIPFAQGLGVFLFQMANSIVFSHPGSNFPGATCWLYGVPSTGQGAIIMTNGIKGDSLSMEIVPAIIKEYGESLGD